jgi:hypothetical protein
MKTLIPAVFFQKQLKGSTASVQKPEKLEMFENELDEVVGGVRRMNDGSGGSVTFSYSAGWLDVEQADDCAA